VRSATAHRGQADCGNTAPEGAVGVEMLWLASGRIGAHRLRPFVRE